MTTSTGPGPSLPRPLADRLRNLPVRRLDVADLAACSDLAESRGWEREEHKWRLLLTSGQGYGVEAPDRAGALIGACVLTPYPPLPPAGTAADRQPEPGAAEQDPGSACVGMMLVAERFARQGLGRRLMEHAVAEAGGALLFLYATGNGRPLYEQLGFRAAGTVTSLRGRLTAAVGGESGPAGGGGVLVRRAETPDLPAVRALDARAFGADRGRLLDRLPRFADRFVVAEAGDGSLIGFAAAWPNGPVTVVGPVVALDTATAQALVRDLGEHTRGELRLDVDARQRDLERWARRHGLEGGCLCTLMVRGVAPRLLGDVSRRFAPYSVALG